MRQRATRLTSVAAAGRAPFRLSDLFKAGQQGLWWMPESHRAALAGTAGATPTLFQDSVGTSAVGAIEQPVGRVVDQSGRGNHATQSTAPARPALTARDNLLVATEDFSSPAWTKFSLGSGSVPTVAPNTAAAPDGSMTADVINFSAPVSGAGSFVEQSITVVSGRQYADAIFLRAATPADVGKVVLLRAVAGLGYMPVTLTAEWVRHTRTETAGSTNGPLALGLRFGFSGSATTCSVAVLGAHRNIGATAGRYQRVNTATDYDWQAGRLALNFDGLDDSLATNFAAGTFGSEMDAWIVCSLAAGETSVVLVDDPTSAGARYFGVLDSTQSTLRQRADGVATANSSWSVNGSLAGGTANPSRAELYAAVAQSGRAIVQASNLDLAAFAGTRIGNYAGSGSGFSFQGRHFAVLICPAQSDATRARIRRRLAQIFGIGGVV